MLTRITTFLRYHCPEELWNVITINITTCTRSIYVSFFPGFSGLPRCYRHLGSSPHYIIKHTCRFCLGDNPRLNELYFRSTTTVKTKLDKTVTSYCRHRRIVPTRHTWGFSMTGSASKLHFVSTTTIKGKLNKTIPSFCRHLSEDPHFQQSSCI